MQAPTDFLAETRPTSSRLVTALPTRWRAETAATLVIVDANDKTIDCETKDLPGARRLIVGRYALVRAKGEFGLRLPAGRRFFNLTENLKIPIGSTIDPNDSVVTLATARNRSGARQVALVSGGRFTVRQRGDRRPVTELRLAGAPPDCPVASRRQGVAKRRPPRKLDVEIGKKKQRGRYMVRGKYSIGGRPAQLGRPRIAATEPSQPSRAGRYECKTSSATGPSSYGLATVTWRAALSTARAIKPDAAPRQPKHASSGRLGVYAGVLAAIGELASGTNSARSKSIQLLGTPSQ
jgi:hypothetical protein